MPSGVYERKGGVDWDNQPLGILHDKVLAQRLGCTPQAVYYARRQRGIAPSADTRLQRTRCEPSTMVEDLGKDKDRIVAEQHGVTAGQVAYARRKLGIAPKRIDWSNEPLGSAPDIVLAQKHGVDNKVVAEARWRRRVDKWQEARECPCGNTFTAFHRRQRYCSCRCQRYHWQLVNQKGMLPEAADVAIALWAYKRTIKSLSKGRNRNVEEHARNDADHP